MNLLLLLTALLASLTGAGSGERTLRQVQGVAVVQAAQAARAAVSPARRAIPAAATPRSIGAGPTVRSMARTAPLAATYLPFERRLE